MALRLAGWLWLLAQTPESLLDSGVGLLQQGRFAEAAASTAELLARHPGDAEHVFNHAQSEYWVAYAARRAGRVGEAEAGFQRYRALAQRLLKVEPGKAEWQLEVAYAEQALGVLMFETGRPQPALTTFLQARAVFDQLAPTHEAARSELPSNLGWIAKAQENLGRWPEALDAQRRNAEIERVVSIATQAIQQGTSPVIFSAEGPDDAAVLHFDRIAKEAGLARPEAARRVGATLADVMARLLDRARPTRIVVAGGDSSGEVASALHIEALTVAAGLSPGAPLCRAWSTDPRRDGLEIVLKGGQIGQADFFGLARTGVRAADQSAE